MATSFPKNNTEHVYTAGITFGCEQAGDKSSIDLRIDVAENLGRTSLSVGVNAEGLEKLQELVKKLQAQKATIDSANRERLRGAVKGVIDAEIALDKSVEHLKKIVTDNFIHDKTLVASVLAHEESVDEEHAGLHDLIRTVDHICGGLDQAE